MSYVIFNNFVDLASIGTPSGGYIVAYDLDGILKQKDIYGNVTPIDNLGGFTPSLDQVLLAGNNTGTSSIIFASGSYLLTDYGSASIQFYKDTQEHIWLSNDGFTGQKSFIDISDDITIKNTGNTGEINLGVSNTFTSSQYQDIAIIENKYVPSSVNSLDRSSIYIGTRDSSFNSGVSNSVIIGGTGISATQSNTVYLGNSVNINNSYTLPNTDGSDGQVLRTDGFGNIYWAVASFGTPSLSDVLGVGNITGNNNIIVESGYLITSSTGSGQLDLGTTKDVVNLSVDFNYLRISNNDIKIYAASSTSSQTNISIGVNNGDIIVSDNSTFSATASNTNKGPVFIGTRNSSFSQGITNSVIIGGINISATQSNTVYVSNLQLQGNVLGKYTIQPDTQVGWDDLSIPTKKYVDDQLSSNLVTEDNSGIEIIVGTTNSTINTTYNTQLSPTLAMPTTVGGLPAGTTAGALYGFNMVEMFNDLLFPTVNPTYTIPTLICTSNVTGIQEIGLTVSPNVFLTGTENDAGPYSQLVINKNINSTGNTTLLTVSSTSSMLVNTVGSISPIFGYVDPNNPNLSYTVLISDTPFPVPAPVSGGSSTVVYSGTGNYDAGLAKKNNKGVTHSATAAVRNTTLPQASSTGFTSNSQTITGYYPYFYGKTSTSQTANDVKSIIESGSGFTKVVNNGSGSLTMAFAAVGEWPWFAVYSVYPTKSAWYENALNSGNIGLVPTDLFSSPTTLTVNSPDGIWSVTYNIYVANKVTTLASAIIS